MKRLLTVLFAAALTVGAIAACSSSGDDKAKNPFNGSWSVPAYGVTVTINDNTWSVAGIGSGDFSYQGDYPDYAVTLKFQGSQASGTAHFLDERQFRGCFEGDCARFNKI